MKIILKRDWDVPFYPPVCESSDQGNFVGRDKEILPLINDILRKKSGSILISGYRGVGKTSLVYKALSEVKKKQKNTIFVFLNGTQLIDNHEIDYNDDNNDKIINKRKILENLIRRLYSTIEENENEKNEIGTDTSDKISELYHKTMAKEFKLLETTIKNQELSRKLEETKTLKFSFNEKNIKLLLIMIGSFLLALIIQFKDIFTIKFLNDIIPLLLTFHVPFTLKYVSEKEEKNQKDETKKYLQEKIYQFDNNVGSLEFDLENIHRDLSLKNKKLIYVIDELDKIPTEKVKKIFEYFKNLFTLSDAQFIFICGEDLYNKIHIVNNIETSHPKGTNLSEEENTYRPKEYTYFTSKFFLSRPISEDLDAFFKNIIENIEIEDGEEDYFEILKKSLLFESKNDFFDLKTYIRSRITNFEDEKPIIEYKYLERKDITKARFQEAICILFEQKYMSIKSSKWKENEEILRELFNYTYEIYNSSINAEFADFMMPRKLQVVEEARRDFNKLLQRCGAFSISENKNTDRKSEEQLVYRYHGEIPSKIPLRLEERTEFEEKFVRSYEEYFDYVTSILNSYRIYQNEEKLVAKEFLSSDIERKKVIELANKFRFSPAEVFESYGKTYEILIHNDTLNTENINRDLIEEKTQELKDKTNILIQNLPRIVGRIIQILNPNLNTNSSAQKGNLLDRIPQETRQILLSDNDRHILPSYDFSKQILLINGKDITLEKIQKHIFADTQYYLVVFFADILIAVKYLGLQGENIRFINCSLDFLQDSIVELLNKIPYFLEEKLTE